MKGSPEIWSENRVHRWHSTQRSRSSRIWAEIEMGLGKVLLTPRYRDSPRPSAIAWFCSGHSPPLSQIGQSSGWLMSSSSRMPSWALRASSEETWVLTTIPSATGIVQEGCGLGKPRPLPASGISTRHCLQAPAGSSSGWSQNLGMAVPICSAARMMRVPLGTLTCRPSMVRVTDPGLAGAIVACVVSTLMRLLPLWSRDPRH